METFEITIAIAILFAFGGAIAGFIDAIAGGGGLITLPLLSIALGPGVHAIGSNKIVGTAAAFVALVVYARQGHFDWRRGWIFCAAVSAGSYLGSICAPLLPAAWMRWFLITACPILLVVVWRKGKWVSHAPPNGELAQPQKIFWAVIASGLACGFYDGAFGPGGGTFMLLALALVVKLPLFTALAISKLANTLSAFTSLLSYAHAGYVHWFIGALVAAGGVVGALLGSLLNLRRADAILRPVLTIAVLLLLLKLIRDSWAGS